VEVLVFNLNNTLEIIQNEPFYVRNNASSSTCHYHMLSTKYVSLTVSWLRGRTLNHI